MDVDVRGLQWDDERTGRLTFHCEALADYKAAAALLAQDSGASLFGLTGEADFLHATFDPKEPTAEDFPSEITVPVRRLNPPSGAARWRMVLSNNYLNDSMYVHVVSLSWDTSSAPRGAALRMRVDASEDYEGLRRFLDHPQGSVLRTFTGDLWFVRRAEDDGDPSRPFPQVVEALITEVPEAERYRDPPPF